MTLSVLIRNHWKLLSISFIVANSAMFQFGYVAVYINTAQNSLTLYVNESYHYQQSRYLSDEQFNWIWSFIVNCYQLGFLFGVIVTPYCVENLGRKWSLIITSVFDIVGTVLSIIAVPLKMSSVLASGRFVIGFGSGLSSSAITLYLQEISPTELRGTVSSFQELSVSVVSILGTVLGLPNVLGDPGSLSYLFAISFLPALPKLVLLFCPETPKYLLIKKNRWRDSRLAIEFYHGRSADVDKVFGEILKEKDLEKSDTDNNGGGGGCSKFLSIFRVKHFRKAVILGTLAFVAQETTGIVPLLEYTSFLLEKIRVSQKVAYGTTVSTCIGNTITTAISLWLVEKYGRRKIFLTSLSVIVILLITFMVCYFVAPLTESLWPGYLASFVVLLFSMVFGLGPGAVPWFITAELVPQSVRSTAQSFTQVVNILVMYVVSFAFLPLFYSTGPYSYLILFILPTLFCTIYMYFKLPETRNREINDIVLDLQRKNVNIRKSKNVNVIEKF